MIKNKLIIITGIILLLISNYLGHIQPPFSISWTPILIGLFTGLVLFITDFRLLIKFSLIIGMIISNDVLIKFFAGGTHDWEGVEWITIYCFLGLILSLILIIIYGFIKQKKNKKEYFLNILGSIVIITAYLSYFYSLGMVSIDSPTEQIELSKRQRVFISEVQFSEKSLIIGNDTFTFKQGWFERQTRLNHLGLFRKTEFTGENNCIIVLDGKFDKFDSNNCVFYNVNDSNVSGSNLISRNISFKIDNSLKEQSLYFHNQNDWTKYKRIKVKKDIKSMNTDK